MPLTLNELQVSEIKLTSQAKTKDKDKTKLKQAEINGLVLDIAEILGLIE